MQATVYETGYVGGREYRYGIVDAKGCILVDPVYSDVYYLEDRNSETTLPFLVFKKTSDSYTSYQCGLTTTDGSFVLDCIYSYIAAYDDRIFAFHSSDYDSPASFDVYNLDGKLVLSSADLPFKDKLHSSMYIHQYGEGLYLIATESTPGEYDCEYYFMDEKGNLLFGPYSDAKAFSDGYAPVQLANGDYSYIDKEGQLFPMTFAMCEPFVNGRAIVRQKGYDDYSGYALINTKGNILIQENSYISSLGSEYYCIQKDTEAEGIRIPGYFGTAWLGICYTADGKLLHSEPFCNFYTPFIIDTYDANGKQILKNTRTGKTYPAEDYYFELVGSIDKPFILVRSFEPEYREWFLTQDFEELPCPQNQAYTYVFEPGFKPYEAAFLSDKGAVKLCLDPDTVIGTYPISRFNTASIYSGFVASFTDEFSTRFYNPEGEQIFCYPIIASMDD